MGYEAKYIPFVILDEDGGALRIFLGKSIQLLYYPPYHSKYNPIGQCWGILEQHWKGT
jgi:transposase